MLIASATGVIGRWGLAASLSAAGHFSFIHIDDAVSAALHAIDGGWGVYNIVDDQPTTVAEFIPELAQALGAPAPRRVSAWLDPPCGRHPRGVPHAADSV
jgi:nucleoside-diphosphate-sugar epimerase